MMMPFLLPISVKFLYHLLYNFIFKSGKQEMKIAYLGQLAWEISK